MTLKDMISQMIAEGVGPTVPPVAAHATFAKLVETTGTVEVSAQPPRPKCVVRTLVLRKGEPFACGLSSDLHHLLEAPELPEGDYEIYGYCVTCQDGGLIGRLSSFGDGVADLRFRDGKRWTSYGDRLNSAPDSRD